MSSNKQPLKLNDDLTVYTERIDFPFSIKFSALFNKINQISLTIDFSTSSNIKVIPAENAILNGKVLTIELNPFEVADIGNIEIENKDLTASIKYTYKWTVSPPKPEISLQFVKQSTEEIEQLVNHHASLSYNSPHYDLDEQQKDFEIYSEETKDSFIDVQFPPLYSSLYDKNIDVNVLQERNSKFPVHWRRPINFMDQQPEVFVNDIHADDIKQGLLGDCWFLSALASLAEFPILIRDIFFDYSENYNEKGYYDLLFFKNGKEMKVRVDDYFPCFPHGGPIYSRANGDELWVLVTEKAYAKIHGCYDALRGGDPSDALIDLTGCPCYRYNFKDMEDEIRTDNFFNLIKSYDEKNYVLSASTPGEDHLTETGVRLSNNNNGLVFGHAYTLISIKELSTGQRIVKLRNPWGELEWNGDWSDSSPLWTPEIFEEIGEVVEQVDDGTFWMSWEDLLTNFAAINACIVRREGLIDKPWKKVFREEFEHSLIRKKIKNFDKDNVAVFNEEVSIINKNFIFELTEASTIIIGTHQKDKRIPLTEQYIDSGFVLLKLKDNNEYEFVTAVSPKVGRQVFSQELFLNVGKYIIVPISLGLAFANQVKAKESTDKQNDSVPPALVELNANGKFQFTKEVVQAYTKIFKDLDVNNSGTLSKTEIDSYLLKTEGITLTEDDFINLLNKFNITEKSLTLENFINVQLFYIYNNSGIEQSFTFDKESFKSLFEDKKFNEAIEKLRNELVIMGFNNLLSPPPSRSLVLTLHSTTDNIELKSLPYDEQLLNFAIENFILTKGKLFIQQENYELYNLSHKYNGLSLLVKNLSDKPLIININCTDSTNLVSSRGNLNYRAPIKPKSVQFIEHFSPLNLEESWKFKSSVSFVLAFDN